MIETPVRLPAQSSPAVNGAVLTALKAARALAPQIQAYADQIEEQRELPRELVEALLDAKLFQILLPEKLGGREVDLPVAMRVIEEVAKADGSTGWCVMQANTIAWHVREAYAQPRAIWANGSRGKGTAVVVEGGYRVTGRWDHSSGCRHATWFLGPGCEVVENGLPRTTPDGTKDIRNFWFPAAEVEIIDTWHVTGLRGTGTHDWAVTDVFVPDIPNQSPDEARSENPLYRLPFKAVQSTAVSSVGLGIARGAIDAFIDLAASKKPYGYGANVPLRESEYIQIQAAQAEAQLRAGRAFLFEATEALWEAVRCTGEAPMEQRVLVRLATTHAIAAAAEAVDIVFRAGGATAIRAACPLERRFRDMHAVRQHLQG
ncbi:MAG TPA: acyl-CoA dehydrogenase family protein, partial [Chloroflexota bacterium]|nr:acyl-CoA dehydrogenase family protein [Chloroflexota bacterium]